VLRTPPFIQRIFAGLRRLIGERLLTCLHRIPDFLVNDAHLRHFLNHPLGFRIETRNPLSRVRVFQVAEPVPDEAADIEFVVEDANTALRVTMDRRRPPFGALRPRHALLVQLKGDRARRLAGNVVCEDTADDGGLRLVDRPIAADWLAIRCKLFHHVITEAEPATGLAILDTAAQPAARLIGKVFQKEGVHRPLETDMQMRHVSFG
jgi:hypothetical protein